MDEIVILGNHKNVLRPMYEYPERFSQFEEGVLVNYVKLHATTEDGKCVHVYMNEELL